MKCTNCQHFLEQGASFCNICGARQGVGAAPTESAYQQQPTQSAYQQQPTQSAYQPLTQSPYQQPPTQSAYQPLTQSPYQPLTQSPYQQPPPPYGYPQPAGYVPVKKGVNVGAIVGIVVGGLFLISILAAIIIPLAVNQSQVSQCEEAMSAARGAHSAVAEEFARQMTRGTNERDARDRAMEAGQNYLRENLSRGRYQISIDSGDKPGEIIITVSVAINDNTHIFCTKDGRRGCNTGRCPY
jgi:type II secretory pathway pseudopilin PulG